MLHSVLFDDDDDDYRRWGDEWSGDIYKEGPETDGRANRDRGWNHQPVLSDRFVPRRENLGLDRSALHDRPGRRHLLHGSHPHGILSKLSLSHVRAICGGRWHRLCSHDCPRLHGRSVPSFVSWLSHLLPRGIYIGSRM